jgi:hypothetical protein
MVSAVRWSLSPGDGRAQAAQRAVIAHMGGWIHDWTHQIADHAAGRFLFHNDDTTLTIADDAKRDHSRDERACTHA